MTCTICLTFYLDAGMQWMLGLYSCTISHQLSTVPLVNYMCEGWGGGGGCSMSGDPPLKEKITESRGPPTSACYVMFMYSQN